MNLTQAQTLVDDLSAPVNASRTSDQFDLFTEYIRIIGNSRRIFIMTNENQRLMKGDFFSIIIDGKLTARALVAQNKESMIGVKILRIDSLANWARIRKGLAVEILRGDDTYYRTANAEPEQKSEENPEIQIKSEEDLFNTTVLEEDIDLDDKKNRAITSDNLLGIGYGFFSAETSEGGSGNYNMFSAQWAYQIADDIWVEGLYGQSLMRDYPVEPLETLVTNITARFKYCIKAPFYSFVLPYVGFQVFNVSSPEAGVAQPGSSATQADLDRELELVNSLKRNQIVFGVTALRRLVPGWFARVDIGTDIISGGVTIEF